MRAFLRTKYIVYVAIAALLTTEAAARFLIDDIQEDIKQEQTRQNTGSAPSAAQTQAPSKIDSNPNLVPPDYPRNMSVTLLNGEKNSVQITWESTAEARDSFVVLRSNQLQNSPDIILNSTPIKMVSSDSIKVVLDRNLTPGRYFYAIIPKTKFDDKNIRLYPGENYSTNPMVIFGDGELGDSRTVASIHVVTIEDRSVLLTWEPINNFTGEYVIFRSKMPIDTPEKLNNADPVGRVHAAKSRFLDNDAMPGRHFYAVACKTIDGIMYSDLKKGFNYTDDAVFIGGTIGIRSIRAKIDNGSALITWKMTADSFNKMFYLLRTETRPTSRESLTGAFIVDTVMSSAERYLDKGLPVGKFYYVLAPMNYHESDDFVLIGGVNVTDPPLVSANSKDESATKPEKKETAPQNNKEIKPLPKKAEIGPSDEDILAYLEELKDLSKTTTAPQKEEKAVAPDKGRSSAELKLPWDDEKDSAVEDNEEPAASAEKKESEKKTDLKKNTKSSDVKKPEKKNTSRKTEDNKSTNTGNAIDSIISGSFSRGDYSQSINLLKSALRKSPSPAESAKAKLYIARSYIELGRYRDALGYLGESEVKRYYPRECGFWQDYSIDRLQ